MLEKCLKNQNDWCLELLESVKHHSCVCDWGFCCITPFPFISIHYGCLLLTHCAPMSLALSLPACSEVRGRWREGRNINAGGDGGRRWRAESIYRWRDEEVERLWGRAGGRQRYKEGGSPTQEEEKETKKRSTWGGKHAEEEEERVVRGLRLVSAFVSSPRLFPTLLS